MTPLSSLAYPVITQTPLSHSRQMQRNSTLLLYCKSHHSQRSILLGSFSHLPSALAQLRALWIQLRDKNQVYIYYCYLLMHVSSMHITLCTCMHAPRLLSNILSAQLCQMCKCCSRGLDLLVSSQFTPAIWCPTVPPRMLYVQRVHPNCTPRN